MKIKVDGREVEIVRAEEYQAKEVVVNGVTYNEENTLKRHKYSWESTANGVVNILSDEAGHQVKIPKAKLVSYNIRNI